MFVQVVQNENDDSRYVVVLGETLACDGDEVYVLPRRLGSALKVADLPSAIRFQLSGRLHDETDFYEEDTVVVSREERGDSVHVHVTSAYRYATWDGFLGLQATMKARCAVLNERADYNLHQYFDDGEDTHITFTFQHSGEPDDALDDWLCEIADKVRWVEEKGNQRLFYCND